MCKTLIAFCVAACAFTTAARSTTFPTLTTIYVASGVIDNGVSANSGVATVVHCTNASGLSASLRFLVLLDSGGVAGAHTTSVAHGGTFTASTHNVATFIEDVLLSPASSTSRGRSLSSPLNPEFSAAR